jgi:hypothetical protein
MIRLQTNGAVRLNSVPRRIASNSKITRAPHTPDVYRIFESFLASGCPKPIDFPRKKGAWGVKPFGHGKSSNPRKALKYSVKHRIFALHKSRIFKLYAAKLQLIRAFSKVLKYSAKVHDRGRPAPGGGRTHNL